MASATLTAPALCASTPILPPLFPPVLSGLPAILALLDVSGDDPQWQALEPPQRRQRMLDAVKRLLLREAQVQPLLVVFEDLHWIDSETQALLDNVVESLPPARLFLLIPVASNADGYS